MQKNRKFQNDLLGGGASEFAAKAMFDAVRVGGKEELCLPFSWSFARVASCEPGFGLILKKVKIRVPEGPALVHPAGVIRGITFANSVQVSGVGCQVSATEFEPLCRNRS
jgi:hypothetical protein